MPDVVRVNTESPRITIAERMITFGYLVNLTELATSSNKVTLTWLADERNRYEVDSEIATPFV